jgi:hypothetical protein
VVCRIQIGALVVADATRSIDLEPVTFGERSLASRSIGVGQRAYNLLTCDFR